MTPDAAYALLVEANPVPDPALLTAGEPSPVNERERLRPPPTGSNTMTLTTTEPVDATAARPSDRRGWIVAAAAVVIAVLGVGAYVFLRDDSEPAEPVDEPPPAPETIPTREELAIETARAYYAAWNAGDAATVVSMSNPAYNNIDALRNNAEFFAVVGQSIADPWRTGSCTATPASEWVEVRCDVVIADPVWAELGIDEVEAPVLVFDDQTIDWMPFEGADFTAANWAYSDYLQAFHPIDYDAVCDPSAYEPGTVNVSGGFTLTAACAELAAPLADDVARWIREGKPDPTE